MEISHLRSSILCLLAPVCFLLISSCAQPERWYDTEMLYETQEETPTANKVDVADTTEIEEEQGVLLPLAKEGEKTLSISLEDAVLLSLQRNRELLIERYAPLVSGAFEQIERGRFDPELFGSLQYSEETSSQISRSTEERFDVEGDDIDSSVGIRQSLPSGTDVEVSASHSRSTSNRTPDQQEGRLGLTVTQSLLKGFGPVVNLIDLRLAELDTTISRYQLRGFVEALVAEVETAYWQYVLATEGIAIYEHSLDIARKQLDEVENRIEVGVIPRNSAAAARAEVARREQALIEARSTHSERRLHLLRLLQAGSEERFELGLQPTSSPHADPAPVNDTRERLQLAVKQRPDLNEARLRRRQEKLEIVRTKNGLLPKLELFIDIGKTGYAESFSDAWTNLGEEEAYDLLGGVRFSTYLGNREAKARALAARASSEQAKAALDNLQGLVLHDVLLAVNELERTRQQIHASSVTRRLQEQTLQAERERFSVGDVTSLPVAQAQRDLLVSELAEIEAIIDYRIARVNLYLAEGSLLERRGVRLGENL